MTITNKSNKSIEERKVESQNRILIKPRDGRNISKNIWNK